LIDQLFLRIVVGKLSTTKLKISTYEPIPNLGLNLSSTIFK